MKKLLLVLFVFCSTYKVSAQDNLAPPQTLTDKGLIQSFSSIQQQTIWFGSEKDSVQLVIVSPKSGWVGTSYLYQKKSEDRWENIPIPFSPAHINSISGIAGKQAYTERKIWIELLSLYDEGESVCTYNLSLYSGSFEKLSSVKNSGNKY